ncbi:hypothetical protein H310_01526 [Aphanomyces invadans]|uniref:SnoaL-like domain-containing protein n=1 Tax=Aphanomyces invadans TaxID=157072 RepID=A0A024URJ0_9STRA|nr:hypothetical protein H310_01526 [Aphanomyces invadans]ETW09066.1 hypothetical protein H310_01526 [Aphanomyces invadans]|eukprot:XP_008862871.1 hypothetical protein H310_01526 [Aphanomyces invadans]
MNNVTDAIEKVMPLYDVGTLDTDTIVDTYYHPDAVFSDPIVTVHGRDKIAAQFRALKTIFYSYTATTLRASFAGDILTIDSVASGRFRPFPHYFGCSIRIFTILHVKNHQVISHTDHWDLKSVVESIPVLSSLYPKVRRVLGYSSTKVINVLSPRPVHVDPVVEPTDDGAAN